MGERDNGFITEGLRREDSPAQVVHSTGIVLPLYFREDLSEERTDLALNFLKDATLSFIDNATRGLLLSAEFMKQAGEKDFRKIPVDLFRRPGFPSRWFESYGLTVVILSNMPSGSEHPGHFVGWQHIPLPSPDESMEVLERIKELRRFVGGVVRQEVTPRNLDLMDSPTRRALAFFQVGRDMRQKELPSKREVVEVLNDPATLDEELKRILRDTPLN